MLAGLPLMLRRPMMRTWLALMGASLAAWLIAPLSVQSYIVIDALAGFIVITRPAGIAQKTIGALFALMVLFHVGYLWGANPGTVGVYLDANSAVGWAQWACLFGWGLWDAGKTALERFWSLGRAPALDGRAR